MPVLAIAASDLIFYAIVGMIGAAAVWLIGHTVEKDVEAVGTAAGSLLDKAGKNVRDVLNPGVLIAVLAVAFLVMKAKKGS